MICIQSSNALQGNQASLFPNQNGRSIFGLKCFWIQQTKSEKVLIHQVLSSSKVFGFVPNIWTSKNVSISREPLKKNKWNILEPHVKFAVSYGHCSFIDNFPPPPARCDVLKGSRLWMPESEVMQVAVVKNNHRTAKQNRDFPKRIFHKIGISSIRNSMVCWKPLESIQGETRSRNLDVQSIYREFWYSLRN